jgi:hypothetical protein
MGFDIYGSNMYVGRLGSAHATCLLDDYLEKKGGKELREFANTGRVAKTPELMKEIAKLPVPDDPDIKVMLDHFLSLVNKCEDVIMLSDGSNIDVMYIFDAGGCVGELCWPNEVTLLNNYLKRHGGELLKELAKNGTVKKSAALMKEFATLTAPKTKADRYIQYRVDRLNKFAKRCRKSVTITDGMDDDIEGLRLICVPAE